MQTEVRENKQKILDAEKKLAKAQLDLTQAKSLCSQLKARVRSVVKHAQDAQIDRDNYEQELEECIQLLNDKITELEIGSNEQNDTLVINFDTRKEGRGHQYNSTTRKLYYALLAERVPPGKIQNIVKCVVETMVPGIEIDSLQLPGKTCADYMRRDELPTLSRAHKAHKLGESTSLDLGSDGTTKNLQKIGASLANGMVLGVHDLPDGSAIATLEAIQTEMEAVKQIGEELGYCTTGLTLAKVQSSTSDGAATQSKLNRLLQEEKDEGELVDNKCAMHLGANIRTAQVAGIQQYNDEGKQERYEGDSFVHAAAKLIGQYGVPEYGQGGKFKIFLMSKLKENNELDYYKEAVGIELARQVGSRYYVTAYNAGRLFYLAPAIIQFLHEQKVMKSLNQLEVEVEQKLQSERIKAELKVDGLFFDKVYADLMMLVKSTELDKSVLDMSTHYLELQVFLEELSHHPEELMNPEYHVFQSEPQLYGRSSKTNHRVHKSYKEIRRRLYQSDSFDEKELYPRIQEASKAMVNKLTDYMKDHLPGGKYWEPSEDVRQILSKLKPQNDDCESVLGMNDWLTTAFPKMTQQARSALIEVASNRTIDWLKTQLPDSQEEIIALAAAKRHEVAKERKSNEERLKQRQITQRETEMQKCIEKANKEAKERQKLE